MKKIKYLFMLLMGMSFVACEKDLKLYEGKDGLYFDVQYTITPWFTNPDRYAHQIYSYIKFANIQKEDSVLNIKVSTVGETRDYDRPFQIKVVEDSTTVVAGEEYELTETGVIKAGDTKGYITVKVNKTDRMAAGLFQLQLALIPNEHFSLPYETLAEVPGRYTEMLDTYSTNTDPRIHNIFMTDVLAKPKYWGTFFGTYSEKKYRLFLELYPDAKPDDYELNTTMPAARMKVIAEKTAKYLKKKKEEGTPVLDEDGTVMYVQGVNWAAGTLPEDL